MYASTHTDALTWSQRLILAGMLSLLLGCAAAIGVAAWLSHNHAGQVVPVVPAAPAPLSTTPGPVVIPDNA